LTFKAPRVSTSKKAVAVGIRLFCFSTNARCVELWSKPQGTHLPDERVSSAMSQVGSVVKNYMNFFKQQIYKVVWFGNYTILIKMKF
jgi:hypothetical protein